MAAIPELKSLEKAFQYNKAIPLMGFKGQLDQLITIITSLFEKIGIGNDMPSYTAFLKLQEIREELMVYHDVHKISLLSLTHKDPKLVEFWDVFQHIDQHMRGIIGGIEKESVNLAMTYGKENYHHAQKTLKYCANQLNRVKQQLQVLYS